jgi:hypothetical protein
MESAHFQELLAMSPNLHHLVINYDSLQPLLDKESVCHLLGHRITLLYIHLSLSTSIESTNSSIPCLVSVFPHLKHLYFSVGKTDQSAEALLLTVFSHLSKWNSLVSFGVVDIVMTPETLEKGLRQWVLENSSLRDHNSFVTDYSENIFRLWL